MPQQDILRNIFDTPVGGDTRGYFEKLTKEYPYFGIAHFYLLKETQLSAADYENIAGRTALHFNNPFYLNYLLNKKETVYPAINPADQKIKSEIKEPQFASATEAVEIKVEEKEEPILFEPLYTTDYFASQGIKLSEEVKQNDKLGKQLKSFTEWLKTMKKVHDGKAPIENELVDRNVQIIAEESNKEAGVVTESMAEVYITQQKHKKAREIYEKLSLLDPSKSAYFAAKLQLLKDK